MNDERKISSSGIFLRVIKASRGDVGKGVARVSERVMNQLHVKPGDYVRVISPSKRDIGAQVFKLPKEGALDCDDCIQLDGIQRRNLRVGLGDLVTIEKASFLPCRRLVIAPVDAKFRLLQQPEIIRDLLRGHALKQGDYFLIKGNVRISRPISPIEGLVNLFFGVKPITRRDIQAVVLNAEPIGITIITDDTRIEIQSEAPPHLKGQEVISYEDVGGLKEEIQRLREMIEIPLRYPQLFEHLNIEPPKGVLLYGPPGTGKTLLAKAVANASGAEFISIAGPEIMSKYYGESEQRLREIFKKAQKHAPSIIFIDEIDSIAPKRENVLGEVERRVVAQLLALMDGLEARGQVIVIGATNRPEGIDPALRRPGRFDREIEIGVPNQEERLEILKIHARGMNIKEDVDFEELARRTHGFVGADLAALVREAAMRCIRRVIPLLESQNSKEYKKIINQLVVTKEDFEQALKEVEPSAMREILIDIPTVHWTDIGGLQPVKQQLKEMVEWPLSKPEIFEYHGIKPPTGILLYGPPGTGKTLLAKAVATESEANFIAVQGPELYSKWVGESERALREIFRKARQSAPSIIFFDEIDAITPRRSSAESTRPSEGMVDQLLTLMSGLETRDMVIIMAATNRPDLIDPALLRPGRFDRLIYVPPPNLEERLAILSIQAKNMRLSSDVNLEELAQKTEGFVGADLVALCREAVMTALREQLQAKVVEHRHFLEALKTVRPTMTKEVTTFYEALRERLSQPHLLREGVEDISKRMMYG